MRVGAEVLEAVPDGVGGSLVPAGRLARLLRREHGREAAAEVVEAVGLRDVAVEARRVVLRQHEHAAQAAVDAVGERDVDQPVLAGERDGGLGAVARERVQARAGAAAQDDGDRVVHVGGEEGLALRLPSTHGSADGDPADGDPADGDPADGEGSRPQRTALPKPVIPDSIRVGVTQLSTLLPSRHSRLRADRGRVSEGALRLAPPFHAVIPAYAGTQSQRDRAARVSRGPVGRGRGPCCPRLASGEMVLNHWIPACAGMTAGVFLGGTYPRQREGGSPAFGHAVTCVSWTSTLAEMGARGSFRAVSRPTA